ncbi:GLE1-like protein-domain-containing protein [Usnea florida]
MEIMASPYKLAKDSPSRQLLWELGQLAISTQEGFYAHLDRESHEREALHQQALAAATAKHESVRRTAEQYRERLEEQIQAERKRREDEEQRELEKLRREKVEQEIAERKREVERARAIELEEKRIAEVKRLERESADRRKAERERQDAETAKRREDDRKENARQMEKAAAADVRRREATAAAQKTRSAPAVHAPEPIPAPAPSIEHSTPTTQRNQSTHVEAEHSRYLEIHRALKELRKYMISQAKQNAQLKGAMGDMRREIKKSVGQLRDGKGANKIQLQTTIETLKKAATVSEPQVDVTMFLASPPQVDDRNGPALLVYLLNIFAKAMIAQFINEAGVKPLIADNLGTVASHIFALDNFRWKGFSLIDILIAKFHVVCPVLFGILGDEQTLEGKKRLGWWREEDDGAFVPEQRHFERMTGLGAGFAGISLKNYEKARAQNPYPDKHYWTSLAGIINVPPDQITQTHFVVLKAMIENFESKFLQFFGDAAMAALRLGLVELPRRSPPSVAAKSLAGLVDVLKRDKKLVL